jgi:hypothetical protein
MKIICSENRRGSALLLVLLLLPLATSCGGQAKGTVSGKVTYQGKPLPSGIVTFVPETGAPQYADIQKDGTYNMTSAPLGSVKIGVQVKSGQEVLASGGMPRNPKDYGKLRSAMSESGNFPPKYSDPNQSELTYTVTKGTQQHDIELK